MRWGTAHDEYLVLDPGSNDPLIFTREHLGELTEVEFLDLVRCVSTLKRLKSLAEDVVLDTMIAPQQVFKILEILARL